MREWPNISEWFMVTRYASELDAPTNRLTKQRSGELVSIEFLEKYHIPSVTSTHEQSFTATMFTARVYDQLFNNFDLCCINIDIHTPFQAWCI
uniref:Uncharacterized protein n=1 Tax=Trichuris muris TaxID=70415 RepID=A0A5S6R4Z8_TRIMR